MSTSKAPSPTPASGSGSGTQLRVTAPAFAPREPSTPVRGTATPRTLRPGTPDACPRSIQRLRRTPSHIPSTASSSDPNSNMTRVLASASKLRETVAQAVVASGSGSGTQLRATAPAFAQQRKRQPFGNPFGSATIPPCITK